MNSAIASRIPLVCRPKPPGAPLAQRIAALTALTVEPADAAHHQLVAQTSGILNFAALIASDVGLPDLAADLCWRQYKIFADAGNLDQEIVVMALMPLVNIARLLVREGDGHGAFELLQLLYRAAQLRATTAIRDHHVDMSRLIRTDEDHRTICTELWVTLLVDGARALASTGRWTEAAQTMAAHRGVGNRLLDGRQIMIMSLIEQGSTRQATDMIDSSVPAEPWENAVAAILRSCCRSETSSVAQQSLDLGQTLALITQPEPMTAAFRVRIGLTALDLGPEQHAPHVSCIRAAVFDAALSDAYGARDVLRHPTMSRHMSDHQHQGLAAVLTESGLGSKTIPAAHRASFTSAIRHGEDRLRTLLESPS